MSKHERARKEHGHVLENPPGGETGPAVEQIAVHAYTLWEMRGRPHGDDQGDWFEAERQLKGGIDLNQNAASPAERGRAGSEMSPGPAPGRAHPQDRTTAEQAREARENDQARHAVASSRDRMVDIGRGNQQAGRQGQ